MQASPLLLLPVLLLLQPLSPADGGLILAFPGEYSHWLNMKTIMEELVRRNHSVTILVPDASPSINYSNSRNTAKFNFLVFKAPYSRADVQGLMNELIRFSMYEWHASSTLQKLLKVQEMMQQLADMGMQQCDAMLKNEQLMATLRAAAFDAVLLDPMVMCGNLVADVLGLPLIISLRFTFGSFMEGHCGHALAPLSFDRMTFVERLVNTLTYVFTLALTEAFWRLKVDQYYSEVTGHGGICAECGRSRRGGGFLWHHGNNGGVNVIAAAFGQIPQKVIWRFRGDTPRTLAPNTNIYDWIPQNDLLGHLMTRAFVTHGGTNGLYEAVFHGVPLVGGPLFGNQSDNLARLRRRGAAIVLDFNYLMTDELMETLHMAIN